MSYVCVTAAVRQYLRLPSLSFHKFIDLLRLLNLQVLLDQTFNLILLINLLRLLQLQVLLDQTFNLAFFNVAFRVTCIDPQHHCHSHLNPLPCQRHPSLHLPVLLPQWKKCALSFLLFVMRGTLLIQRVTFCQSIAKFCEIHVQPKSKCLRVCIFLQYVSGREQKIEPTNISFLRVRCRMHNKTKTFTEYQSSVYYSTESLNGWWTLKTQVH